MKTIRFEVSDDDFAILSEIAAVFYEGCTRGGRPLDVQDLARFALLAQREEMAWAINKNQPMPGEPPANVFPGPWKLSHNISPAR
jgi:hypothetical protein